MRASDDRGRAAMTGGGAAAVIGAGRGVLGIELGSTRIKLSLLGDDPSAVLATGAHEWENRLEDGRWTYSVGDIESGLAAAYAALVADAEARLGIAPTAYRAVGVSAMMHGYLARDEDAELLVPFRTWRNTSTGPAAAELSAALGVNIPQRWSVAHLRQAVRDGEPHIDRIRSLTTLAGYVHERLGGRRMLGIGDASGMFPVDASTRDWDATLLDRYDALAGSRIPLRDLLPEVLVAGVAAGELSAEGAALLDPTGALRPGALLCPPEGDAGTGMVATGAVAPRTGNVSAGTSIFAMAVLERPLAHPHEELDVVATPAGDPVAMVHCNNGASELAAWVGVLRRFAELTGAPVDADAAYAAVLAEALGGDVDAGGILAYNQLAGEPVVGLESGSPLVLRTPDSRLTLANLARAQVYGVFAVLSLGMRVLAGEGVAIDRMHAHGGIFRTAGVAQRLLAAALDVPVAVAESAGEGGAWGMAVLAAYAADDSGLPLDDYLRERVLGPGAAPLEPDPEDVRGFAAFLDRYRAGLDVERAAAALVSSPPDASST